MDTSVDQNTLAFDFLSGIGVNLPKPTDEQYARRIIEIGERLHSAGVLHSIITASTYCGGYYGGIKLTDDYVLGEAMRELLPVRYQELRNACFMCMENAWNEGLLSLSGTGEGRYGCLYLGCEGDKVLWFWVEWWDKHSPQSDGKSGPAGCVELDVALMTSVFSRVDYYATPFPQDIVRWLIDHMKRERDRRCKVLSEFERQTTLLEVDYDRFKTIDEMPPREQQRSNEFFS